MKHTTDISCAWATNNRSELIAARGDGAAAVVDLNGRQVSAVIPEPLGLGSRVVMLPKHPVVVIGQFEAKTVSAYNWLSGERLWRLKGFKELFDVTAYDSSRVVVLQLTGRCREVDALTGSVIADIQPLASVHSEPTGRRLLVSLGRSLGRRQHRELKSPVELRHGLGDSSERHRIHDDAVPTLCDFADDWIVWTENRLGLMVCTRNDGTEAWRYVPEGELVEREWGLEGQHNFRALVVSRSQQHVLGIRQPKFKASSKVDSFEAMVFDVSTGKVLRSELLPREHLATLPVANGEYLAARDGLLHVDTLTWQPRVFRIE